jgi:hypothetical protein
MAGYRFTWKSFALITAIGLSHSGFAVNPLTFDSIDPDVYDLPNYNNCFERLNGIDGYFYARVCLNQAPGQAVYRSQNGVDWEQVGPGTRGTEGFKLANGKVLLYGEAATITIGQGDSWMVKDIGSGTSNLYDGVEGVGKTVMAGSSTPSRSKVPTWWVSTDGGDNFTEYTNAGYSNPLDTSPELYAVVYGGGKYVAVGPTGEAWVSEDAVSWTAHAIPQADNRNVTLYDVAYHGGHFIACGDHDTIYRSADGETWELLYTGTPFAKLDTLLIDGNNWYAGGEGRSVVASIDGGQNFTQYSNLNYLTSDLTGGNGYFYAGRHLVPEGGQITPERQVVTGWWDPFLVQEVAYTQGKWLVLKGQDSFFGQSNLGKTNFWANSVLISDDVYEHDWFGQFASQSGDWAYHFDMGWVNAYTVNNSDVWIFADELGWIFTSEAYWPYFYHFNSGHFAHYDGDPDWFWNVYLEADMQRNEFYDMPWPVRKDWLGNRLSIITDSLGSHLVGFLPEISSGVQILSATMDFKHPDFPGDFFVLLGALNTLLEDIVTDTSRDAGLVPGRQFTIYVNPIASETPPEPNELFIILTFDNDAGGTSNITYDFGPGYQAADVEGTFTVGP